MWENVSSVIFAKMTTTFVPITHALLQYHIITRHQNVESESPPIDSRLLQWLHWPITYSRSNTLRFISPDIKQARQFLFLCSERSQLPCKKCDYPNVCMLWEAQLAMWRGHVGGNKDPSASTPARIPSGASNWQLTPRWLPTILKMDL